MFNSYDETFIFNAISQTTAEGKTPVYVVHFTNLDASQSTQDFTSINVATREEKTAIASAIQDFKFKTMKRQPLEKNFVNWDKQTYVRLISASPERLSSRFQVSHGMLLNVLSRKGDGCRAMQQLISRSHESPKAKKAHIKRAWQLFRALVDRNIIEFIPPTEVGSYLRVNVELHYDFSMDQVLSLYLLDTVPLLDPQALDYALDLITLVESIIEDPDIILRKQLDRVKDQKMAEMKM